MDCTYGTKKTLKVDILRTMKIIIIGVYLNYGSIDSAFQVRYTLIFVIRASSFLEVGHRSIY